MLSQTKDQIRLLIDKVQLLDFCITGCQTVHKENAEQSESLFKDASVHKLKLISEILRLSNASKETDLTVA